MPAFDYSAFSFWMEQFRATVLQNGLVQGTIPQFGLTYQLTSAQLLALNTTAVQLVPAPTTGQGVPLPPNGFAYYVSKLKGEYVYGGTAYTIGGSSPLIQIEYTGKAVSLASLNPTGLVDQTVPTIQVAGATSGTNFNLSACQNLGLEVKLGGTTPTLTLGNGSLYLHMEYTVIPLF
jgi:hypothetical protein